MIGTTLTLGFWRSLRQRSSPSPPGTMMSSRNRAGGWRSASLTIVPIAAYVLTVNPAPSRWYFTSREMSASSSSTKMV